MKRKKTLSIITGLFLMFPLLVSCVPFEHQKNQIAEIMDMVKDDAIKQSLAQRIRDGLTLTDLIPASVLIVGSLIPIFGILGFVIIVFIFIYYYNRRAMAMIEKGTYERRPLNIRWDLAALFTGLVLLFVGIGISLSMICLYGVQLWSVLGGVIPFLLGIAFLVFTAAYKKMK